MQVNTQTQEPCCSEQQVTVSAEDLPLSCPRPSQAVWNGHPRVFLPIAKTGREVCPYCGIVYMLATSPEVPV